MRLPFGPRTEDEIRYGAPVEVARDPVDEKTIVAIQAHALDDAKRIEKSHQFDPNLPDATVEAIRHAARSNSVEAAIEVDKTFTEDSPYDSVRAAVRPTDGGEVANTLRAWILGFIFITIAAAANMILSMRSPAVVIPTVVIMLLVYPVGCLWAQIMPTKKFNTFGLVWSLNPGPFTIKEHTVVTLMANVTYGYAYSTDALLALDAEPLYNIHLGWGFQLLFTLSSQLIGIAISGMFRRFLVWPAALIWPANFSMTTLLYALHDKRKLDPSQTNGWRISGYRYFAYVAIGSFCWYWFPGMNFNISTARTFAENLCRCHLAGFVRFQFCDLDSPE